MSSQQSGQNSPTNSMPTNAGTSGGTGPLKSPLLHAWHDPLANIKTNSSSMRLVDLNCDGDSKLCICDYEKKLRIYKGTNLMMEYAVLDSPIAMCITYTEQSLVSNRLVSQFVMSLILFLATHSINCCCSRFSRIHLSSIASISQMDMSSSRSVTIRN